MSGVRWFLVGAVAGVACVAMLWWTARSLPTDRSHQSVLLVWGGALLRMAVVTSTLLFAVRESAGSAVLASVGFLLARLGATAWFASRMTGNGGLLGERG